MKSARAHRVPLGRRALEIIEFIKQLRASDADDAFVFPGARNGRLSEMATAMLLRRMGHSDITTHGFRSSFRDWAGEVSSFQREVVEAALAHAVGDSTERAYRRGDALEKRRRLMEAWADYLEGTRKGAKARLRVA
jgi:integrase